MLPDPGKGNNTALPPTTSFPPTQGGQARSEETKTTKIKTIKTTTTETTTTTKTKTKTTTTTKSISEAGAFMDNPVPTTSISATATASTRTASPTDRSVTTDTPSKDERWCEYESEGRPRIGLMDNVHCIFPTMKPVPGAGYSDHVSIYARSDPGNSTSNETATEDHPFKPYSLYFLTNCQWSLDNKTEHCTKPWDFVNYTIGGEFLQKDPSDDHPPEKNYTSRSIPFLPKHRISNVGDLQAENLTTKGRNVVHNRDAFSKVHLTGCVLVGLSFLSTTVSFFILPALGQWISVGNLALATLATIFLFTSSIFTAVLAKEMRNFFEKPEDDGKPSYYTAESGKKLSALV